MFEYSENRLKIYNERTARTLYNVIKILACEAEQPMFSDMVFSRVAIRYLGRDGQKHKTNVYLLEPELLLLYEVMENEL